jgi:helix-turn-helix protein
MKSHPKMLKEFLLDECLHCGGTGMALDQLAIGQYARDQREKAKQSLRSVADQMAISAAYLSDLERGRRNWSQGLWDDFMDVVLD